MSTSQPCFVDLGFLFGALFIFRRPPPPCSSGPYRDADCQEQKRISRPLLPSPYCRDTRSPLGFNAPEAEQDESVFHLRLTLLLSSCSALKRRGRWRTGCARVPSPTPRSSARSPAPSTARCRPGAPGDPAPSRTATTRRGKKVGRALSSACHSH